MPVSKEKVSLLPNDEIFIVRGVVGNRGVSSIHVRIASAASVSDTNSTGLDNGRQHRPVIEPFD